MGYSAKLELPELDRSDLRKELRALIDFYEHVTPMNVGELVDVYHPKAYFKDPFNEVEGVEHIKPIFEEMFAQVINPRFIVHTAFESGGQAFLGWDFLFEMKRFKQGQVQRCRGSSHVRFDQEGRVVYHRDYWDTAEELYEKIPVLGGFMRWLRKQAG